MGKNKFPEKITAGEVVNRKWKIEESIGKGGFGEIYSVTDVTKSAGESKTRYAMKIEPSSNGPLFCETRFFLSCLKPERLKEWATKKKISHLGLPYRVDSGHHTYKNETYRYLVMNKLGKSVEQLRKERGNVLPAQAVVTIANHIIDALEYIHSEQFIHGDLKGANVLLDIANQANLAYLVDFGIRAKYIFKGDHVPDEPNKKYAGNGTIEYLSRDAHRGAHCRRSDMESLGYNLLHWLTGSLPWFANIKDITKVQAMKEDFFKSISASLKKIKSRTIPLRALHAYFTEVSTIKFEAEPDYKKLKQILKDGLKEVGETYSGKVNLNATPQKAETSRRKSAKASEDEPPEKSRRMSPRRRPAKTEDNESPARQVRKKQVAKAIEAISPSEEDSEPSVIESKSKRKLASKKTSSKPHINGLSDAKSKKQRKDAMYVEDSDEENRNVSGRTESKHENGIYTPQMLEIVKRKNEREERRYDREDSPTPQMIELQKKLESMSKNKRLKPKKGKKL